MDRRLFLLAGCSLALPARARTRPRFKATMGGVDQKGFTPGIYNALAPRWSTFEGDGFEDGYWRARERSTVLFRGHLYIPYTSQYDTSPNYVATIVKNDTVALPANIGEKAPLGWKIRIQNDDDSEPGDVYDLRLFVSVSSALLQGHPLHTWWGGIVL